MARKRKYKTLICDFETTVYDGQITTEVWASAVVEIGTEDVKVFHSIEDTFKYFRSLKSNLICYYHNLKFDGNFWLSYLLTNPKLEPALENPEEDPDHYTFCETEEMYNNTFKYVISDQGQWYCIDIKIDNYIIEIRDSLKLLPFSVKEIGKAFKTKHQKLDMEYTGYRYAGCQITPEEERYIKNDVLVVKEALETMFSQGHDKMTIGACCLSEYKYILTKPIYNYFFPKLEDLYLDPNIYGSETVDKYIRRSYKGGWCYLVPGKAGQIYSDGITADVNSLYPSMMSSESGNEYPVGLPTFWTGNRIPEEARKPHKYYFVRFRCRFRIKSKKLPFIQIKGSWFYRGNECLTTSDIRDPRTGKYSRYYIGFDGTKKDTVVTLTLTCTDYILFREQYDVFDFEILDGCYFNARAGIFDLYIEKYKKIKLESTGALRTLAKLFLNNLYGKMAASTDSSFKYAYLKKDGSVGFYGISAADKKAGFIAVGSAITSYARNFTIRAAQNNYYGPDQPGFIYADTDSIHCNLMTEQLKGIPIHDKNFCCWKIESYWNEAIFSRQKTYIEHVTHEDGEPVTPYYNVKCAGMPERCKDLFIASLEGKRPEDLKDPTPEQIEFLSAPARTLKDFDIGLKVPGKLMPKRIPGGMILKDGFYEMRP